jgi:putative pyruvate formate lyase activating enzyme
MDSTSDVQRLEPRPEAAMRALPLPAAAPRTPADLAARLAAARAGLAACALCGLRCGVDRTRGPRGACGLALDTHIFEVAVSRRDALWPAPVLRVALGGCNARCAWCDAAPPAWQDAGTRLAPPGVAAEWSAALDAGVQTILLTGGEPTLHVHTLLAVAVAAGRPLPLVLHSNMYMSAAARDLLAGVVGGYLADFKFGADACARRLAGLPDYGAVVRANLHRVARDGALLIRHVLLPGHLDCCFRPAVTWIAEHLPDSPFQLCPGYLPHGAAARDPAIGRLNSRAEVQEAQALVAALKLPSVPAPRATAALPGRTGAARDPRPGRRT